MRDPELIEATFGDQKIKLVTRPVRDPENPRTYSVFVQVSRNSKGHQTPSKFKLRTIAETLRRNGVHTQLVLLDGAEKDITATIKTTLDIRFPGLVNNAFSNINVDQPIIWIEARKALDEDKTSDVQRVVIELLRTLEATNYRVEFTSSANLPTPTAVLGKVRLLAPVSSSELGQHLQAAGFEVPSGEWLSRMLDRLRRANRVIRLARSNRFALTLEGLTALGSSKNRRSPDIVRALALAKRTD